MVKISFFDLFKKNQDEDYSESSSASFTVTTPVATAPESIFEDSGVSTEIDENNTDMDESKLPVEVGHAQTIGSREDQEDAYGVSDWKRVSVLNEKGFLAVMADGIGGLADGQIASGAAVKGAFEKFETQSTRADLSERVLDVTASAQKRVLEAAASEGSECGCTFLSVMIDDMEMCFSSVGDSRIVLYRNGVLLQLNREHILAREADNYRALTGSGSQDSERRRKAITAYIGKRDLRSVDRNLNPIQLVGGDCVLLMSDGVFGVLSDSEIVAYLSKNAQPAANAIIQAVLEKNVPGQDNATIVVIKIL